MDTTKPTATIEREESVDGRIGAITLRVVPVHFAKSRSVAPILVRAGETKVYDNGGKSWSTTWAAIDQEFLEKGYRYAHESHTRCVQVDGEPHAPYAVLDTPDINAPMMAVWSVTTPRLFKEFTQ